MMDGDDMAGLVIGMNRGGYMGGWIAEWKRAVGGLSVALLVCSTGEARGGDGRGAVLERYQGRVEKVETDGLREAIRDLRERFPEQYPQGDELLSRLEQLEQRIREVEGLSERGDGAPEEDTTILEDLEDLRREALIGNPLVSGRPILFVTRRQYRADHHNTATLFQVGEVNTFKFDGNSALKCIDFARGGEVRTLLETETGVIRDPEVHFDGNRVVFSMRESIEDDYHVYEIGIDGEGLRQLTHASRVADIDPLYLPDDSIVFSSTREPKFCMCNQHIMANLFRMEGDGANIHQIGKSTLFEGHAALLPDGRILYDRWEYVDRNFGDAQGLWTVNPDGTNHCIYWGNNTNSPGGVIDARPIPGSQQVVCIFGSCHDRPWGAVAIIDRRRALDGREAVIRTWPEDAIERVGKGNWDAFVSVKPKYEDPWPLDDTYFLASREAGDSERTEIVLLDLFGNEIVLHAEALGCYDPMPIGPRARPGATPERRDLAMRTGRFFVADVYEGTHMQGVERGSVKWLRVIESPEKRFFTDAAWGGQGVQKPAMNWHDFNNKRILGTAPVEADGSAYFEAPADTFLYFQLLDEDRMMVQSMRSGTMVQAGETAGCIGCHEDRHRAPPTRLSATPLAVRRGPSRLEGWYGPPRLFNYMTEVQPVFDRHCTRCHDYGREAGRALNLAADRTSTFNTSYNELWRKKQLAAIGAGPHTTQAPRTWGSHASRLVAVLREGHEDVQLSDEERDRIVTWVDLNAPFYPRYDCAFPANLAGRCPLTDAQLNRLTELTGVPFAQIAAHDSNRGPQLSFDRPELSPCLEGIREADPDGYSEALAIIQAGADTLRATPRADMPGFVPCEEDRRREEIYAARRRIEERNRRAALRGEKVDDESQD
jgi:hypothetical protein